LFFSKIIFINTILYFLDTYTLAPYKDVRPDIVNITCYGLHALVIQGCSRKTVLSSEGATQILLTFDLHGICTPIQGCFSLCCQNGNSKLLMWRIQ